MRQEEIKGEPPPLLHAPTHNPLKEFLLLVSVALGLVWVRNPLQF